LTKKTVIIIAGPTAVGKTSAAIRLARHLGTSIISADSRQCFKELNIGVAKPTPEQLQLVPHHFINSHFIQDLVNAAEFERLASGWVGEILSYRDYVVMVGGTGLYLKAFCEGLDAIPQVDDMTRREIQLGYTIHGLGWLQDEVAHHDPQYYSKGEILNPQRLMRALEVKKVTGRSILSFHTPQKKQHPYRIIQVGLQIPREELHRNINTRVDQMMQDGLLQEVTSLVDFKHLNALQTVGYKELFEFLEGKTSLIHAIEEIKKNTRLYAKRQMTWFRKNQQMHWLEPGDWSGLQEITQS